MMLVYSALVSHECFFEDCLLVYGFYILSKSVHAALLFLMKSFLLLCCLVAHVVCVLWFFGRPAFSFFLYCFEWGRGWEIQGLNPVAFSFIYSSLWRENIGPLMQIIGIN